ncbi:MAG: rhodanese-like domain-containing protein [Gammaproteobacteria bacterium]|nr:rhodanese-like domain-containing protein [Gammaproteobacteria bacterium]
MQKISRDQLEKKLSVPEPVALIDVLPESSYESYHLPSAINIPLDDERFDEKLRETVPDTDTTIVVYCKDADCQASPKAASRIEALGYRNVYDYEAGKEDWKAAGNTIES